MLKKLTLLALAIPVLVLAQGVTRQSTSQTYTSTAGSGVNGFACRTDGCRLDLGSGASDYLYSDGTRVLAAGELRAVDRVSSNSGGTSMFSNVFGVSSGSAVLKSAQADGSAACGSKISNTVALSNATAGPLCVYSDDGVTLVSKVYADGTIASATEHTLWSWFFNAAAATGACPATGTGCTGHILPARAFTVTAVTGLVSVVSGGGAANTVWTITDGTNTCTATFTCNTSAITGTANTGAKRVATANGAGTGCVYPASAALTISVTTAGCTTTQPTFRNVDVVGKWQ